MNATTQTDARTGRKKKRKAQPRSALRNELFNLPNSLTMGRVFVIPVVMWFMERSNAAEVGEAAARPVTGRRRQ